MSDVEYYRAHAWVDLRAAIEHYIKRQDDEQRNKVMTCGFDFAHTFENPDGDDEKIRSLIRLLITIPDEDYHKLLQRWESEV